MSCKPLAEMVGEESTVVEGCILLSLLSSIAVVTEKAAAGVFFEVAICSIDLYRCYCSSCLQQVVTTVMMVDAISGVFLPK